VGKGVYKAMEKRPKAVLVDGKRGGQSMPVAEETGELAKCGADFVVAGCSCEADLIEHAADADAILTYGAQMTRSVMEKLPNCKVIVRYGIGYDTIDVDAATDNNILVVNIPDFCIEEVSNHAIALILACSKKIVTLNNVLKRDGWGQAVSMQSPMASIYGQTLGIIGCGNIGRATARKAHCFGFKLIGYDPYVDKSLAKEAGISPVNMAELLGESDYISVHTVLNSETRHLVGAEEFKQMKPTAYFINTSRGAVVDESALITALREKRIAGAALDVFEKEPVDPENPLLKMDNVIVLPHTASFSDDAFRRLRTCVGQEAARVLSGRWPKNVVNKDVKPKIDLKRE
jgi:D-3-phosphoglycerate dehydrogenase